MQTADMVYGIHGRDEGKSSTRRDALAGRRNGEGGGRAQLRAAPSPTMSHHACRLYEGERWERGRLSRAAEIA